MLPYYFLPDQITVYLKYFVIMWLNALPSVNGISLKYSPREIVTGHHPDFKNHCKFVCGSYVKAHDDPKMTKKTNPRNHKCISFIPTGNLQGTQKVFWINKVIILKMRKMVPIIAPDQVIRKLNGWCKKS